MTLSNSRTALSGLSHDSFSKLDFDYVAQFAKKNFGLNLPASKLPVVHSRVSRRLRHLGIDSFAEYRDLLETDAGLSEKSELLSALTTNVTEFFREKHHFETLVNDSLRIHGGLGLKTGRVRIWSAGCSTGQEPYSIAMKVLESHRNSASSDIRILATDIDPVVVSKAKEGLFSPLEVEKLPKYLLEKYFEVSSDGSAKVREKVKEMVHFGVFNLIDTFPFKGPFDAIFCRNVAIYFDKDTQADIWSKFCDVLAPQGNLFIGHSERVSGRAESLLKSNGITTYTKVSR
ncbi:MAG: protein-glutamate O-methyltransferase CheR [Planctomycetota bacterium]